jgi:RNA-binding protein
MSLTASQKRYLRGIAHALNPVIMTGNKGVTDAVTREFAQALNHHELVKVKLGSDDRSDRAAQIAALADATKSEVVQRIGRVASFYRRNAKQPRLALPK